MGKNSANAREDRESRELGRPLETEPLGGPVVERRDPEGRRDRGDDDDASPAYSRGLPHATFSESI